MLRHVLLFLLLSLLQLALQCTAEHQILCVAHGHVHFGAQVGAQVTGKKGGSDGFVELAYRLLHKAIGLVLHPVGEGVDDPLPLADILDKRRFELPTLI